MSAWARLLLPRRGVSWGVISLIARNSNPRISTGKAHKALVRLIPIQKERISEKELSKLAFTFCHERHPVLQGTFLNQCRYVVVRPFKSFLPLWSQKYQFQMDVLLLVDSQIVCHRNIPGISLFPSFALLLNYYSTVISFVFEVSSPKEDSPVDGGVSELQI